MQDEPSNWQEAAQIPGAITMAKKSGPGAGAQSRPAPIKTTNLVMAAPGNSRAISRIRGRDGVHTIALLAVYAKGTDWGLLGYAPTV